MHLCTNYGHPERAFFQKFQTFGLGQTNWADLFEAFREYQHYFGTVSALSMGKCIWFIQLQNTMVFRSKTCNFQITPKYDKRI